MLFRKKECFYKTLGFVIGNTDKSILKKNLKQRRFQFWLRQRQAGCRVFLCGSGVACSRGLVGSREPRVQEFGLHWLPSCSLFRLAGAREGQLQLALGRRDTATSLHHFVPPEHIKLSLTHAGVNAYGLSLSATLPGKDKMPRATGAIWVHSGRHFI